jgi:hypothetical protein
VTNEDGAVQRAHRRDGNEPPQEGRRRGWRVEGQVADEARDAELVGAIDASEDSFLQIASELVGHATGTARAGPGVLLGERALGGKTFSRRFFNAYFNRTWNSAWHIRSLRHSGPIRGAESLQMWRGSCVEISRCCRHIEHETTSKLSKTTLIIRDMSATRQQLKSCIY